ncbi:cytochrome P450 [Exophiala viscosa]|uniref:Cytochrome P450 n=1 Tax=Exophiala viscosa TaxID=2486360 RepID=A0AAN6DV55_9EURO|nr:cytochrome P450 [Exophiala viscosa]
MEAFALNTLVSMTVLLLLVAVYLVRQSRWRSKYRFPPSPPGWRPFTGHSHLMPKEFHGDKAKEWADQLGTEMMHLRLGGVDWVFLNSSRVVEDLLEKRSSIYSSRPAFVMVGEIISRMKRLVLQPYGTEWKNLRRVMHILLTGSSADSYRPLEDLESKQAMWELLHNPEEWHLSTIRYAASFTIGMVYGVRQKGHSDLFQKVSDAQDEFLRNNVPGTWLVDDYPQLQKLPRYLHWWRSYGDKLFEITRDAFRGYYDLMVENTKKGTQKDCFATKFYAETESKKGGDFDFDQKLFTTGGLIEAGSDTTKNQLNMLVAAMAADPNTWVKKARTELDSVCGTNAERLPTFDDWDKLPYIQAIMKESMRWRPNVNPTGFPHALIRDDEYEGYVLPAGTVVTINNWAISLNPEEYENPTKFNPDRFLNDDLWNPTKGHYGYGAGRRTCAGFKVAQNSMFIFFSRFIYCFDVLEDPNDPIDTYHIPLTPPPGKANDPPFNAKVRVRSMAHKELILGSCADALEAYD